MHLLTICCFMLTALLPAMTQPSKLTTVLPLPFKEA